MVETSAQEALLAELLGDVHKLREDVAVLSNVVPQAREAIERAGEFAALKFDKQVARADTLLTERILQMAAAVKDASAAREMLVGAVALKASEQARTQLLGVVREALDTANATRSTKGIRRYLDHIVVGLCSAAAACGLTTVIVVRLLSH
ncbi:hypothetical protein GO290_02780 [Ralstonia solanacearum]|uniref:Transmembrane protein n=1 Tax=Ralstonia chuxiongensis TaxID=2957504 RepID=A0AA42BJX7_9RALS|nr:hypothetical protein [Ralstonia chuxiongensis]MCP1175665.1 hypothetical protein [Ralstonia chuxiongensis]NKF95695.1 hypothetical protein [Ralstonia solanacearum]